MMAVPLVFDFVSIMSKEDQLQEILQMNVESEKYGLTLNVEETQGLIEARSQALQNYGRVELDFEAIQKLIHTFCKSPFVSQEEYVSTLKDLLELFYYLKNETNDTVGDAKIIEKMQDYYDCSYAGSMEMLKSLGLEDLIRTLRQIPNEMLEQSTEGDD
jgi:hypothetical protein